MTVRAERSVYRWSAMASPISLHLPGLGEDVGQAVARAVAEDIGASEQALSRFREGAELVLLNEHVGDWAAVSPRLYKALSASLQAWRRTDGLFDPRVLVRLEEYGYVGVPRAHAPAEQPGVWLGRDPRHRQVLLRAPLDLGGIGKGLAVRWAARIARRVTGNFLLNAGGDLIAEGRGPDGGGWQIGVEDPHAPETLKAAVRIAARGAVCTSSIARLSWMHAGQKVHHLIDPRTGRPGGEGILAVTVISVDPAWAEVQSKTLFLRGQSGIVEAARGLAAIWVTDDGSLHVSSAAEPYVFWRAP